MNNDTSVMLDSIVHCKSSTYYLLGEGETLGSVGRVVGAEVVTEVVIETA